ncbi:MAG: bifunctional diguanylate cyclase/phosphodiesterase [Pleomorphochaeta sp.]
MLDEKPDFTKKDYKFIFKRSLYFIIPFTIVFIFLFNVRFNDQKNSSLQLIEKENEKKAIEIDLLVTFIESELSKDLLVIKNSNELNTYLDDNTDYNKNETAQMFARLAKSKSNFDQIRFIDKDGYEKIRVNNSTSNIEIVEDSLLQYKGDRYYFLNSINLEDESFYFSPIDLNIENGKIETPYKALFRVTTPVIKDNEFMGVVVINYLAEDILELIKTNFELNNNYQIKASLVNEEGYYIYNKDERKLFSFMFDDVDYNIQNDLPDFFEKKDINSTFISNGVLYSIAQIKSEDFINPLVFYLVQSFEINNLPIMQNNIIFNLTLIQLIVLIVSDLMIILAVSIIYSKNKDREQLALTNLVSDNTNDAVVITDRKTNIIFVNKAFEKITGYSRGDLLNSKKTNYFKSGLHSDEFYKDMWNSINTNKYWEGEMWDRKQNGLLYPKFLKIYAIENKYSSSIQKYVGIFSDLTKEKEKEKNLQKIEDYNFETNLPNQNLLLKLMEKSVKENDAFGIISLSITNYDEIFFDKDINEVQIIVSNFINMIQRKISYNDFLAQISTNTFVVGILSYDEQDDIINFIKELIEEIDKEDFFLSDKDIFFNLKSGVSIYPKDGDSAIEIFKNSKVALESAKAENKNIVFSSKEVRDSIQKKYLMSVYLKNAIVNDELYLNYQPQVDSEGFKVTGAEALLRWNNPNLGVVSPFFFIPIAEDNGFIIDIGYWVIEQVFKDYNKIKNDLPKEFKISINVSSIQFNDENLFDRIIALSKQYDIDLSKFELELTESIVVSDIKEVNMKLSKFRNNGLSIALDDFGTGFSSLKYLKELLIDKIKIDRAFIKDYPEKDNGTLAKIIVKISKELDLNLISEGVETQEQLKYINSIGCKNIQGYYFSKPLMLDEFKDFVIEHK